MFVRLNSAARQQAPTTLVLAGFATLLLTGGGWSLLPLSLASFLVSGALLLLAIQRSSLRLPWTSAGFFALAGLVALQLVPFGPALEWISPRAHEVRTWTVGEGGGPISYEVHATSREVAKLVLLGMVTWVVSHQTRRLGLYPWLLGLAAVTWLSIAVGQVHAFLGVDRLFGTFRWKLGADRSFTTLVNENHSAMLLVAVALLSVASAHGSPGPLRKRLGVAGCAATLGLAICEGSRGGFVAAVLATIALVVAGKLRSQPQRPGLRIMAAWVGLALAGAMFVREGPLKAWIQDEKLDGLRQVGPIVLDHAWAGVGRGAFSSVFVAYNLERADLWFHFPENFVVQQVAELGIPLGTLVALAMAALPVASLVTSRSVPTALVAATLLLMVLHDVLDFSLEIPAMGVLAAVALGCTDLGRQPVLEARRCWPPAVRLGLAVAPILAVTAALGGAIGGTLRADLHRLQAAAEPESRVEPDRVMEWARRHPANPYVWARASAALLRLGDTERAIKAVNAVLFLAPAYPDAHLLSARLLRQAGFVEQSLLSYRRAWELDEGSSRVGDEVLESFTDLVLRLKALPRDPTDGFHPRQSELIWLAERLLERGAPAAEVSRVIEQVEAGAVRGSLRVRWGRVLARVGRYDEALTLLEEASRTSPEEPQVWRDLVAVATEAERTSVLESALPQALEAADGDWSTLRAILRGYGQLGDHGAQRRVLDRMQDGTDRTQKRQVALLRIEVERAAGRLQEALRLADVLILSGSREREGQVRRTQLLMDLGRHGEAQLELDAMMRAHPDDPQLQKLASRLAAAKNGSGR